MNLLIIEDDLALTSAIAELLRLECKQEAFYADSVQSAIFSLHKIKFDAVMLDYRLKDGFGTEVLPFIPPEATLILMTADLKGCQIFGHKTKAYEFNKPFLPNEIDQMVRIICDLKNETKH